MSPVSYSASAAIGGLNSISSAVARTDSASASDHAPRKLAIWARLIRHIPG
jgi:hypothetical protein